MRFTPIFFDIYFVDTIILRIFVLSERNNKELMKFFLSFEYERTKSFFLLLLLLVFFFGYIKYINCTTNYVIIYSYKRKKKEKEKERKYIKERKRKRNFRLLFNMFKPIKKPNFCKGAKVL